MATAHDSHDSRLRSLGWALGSGILGPLSASGLAWVRSESRFITVHVRRDVSQSLRLWTTLVWFRDAAGPTEEANEQEEADSPAADGHSGADDEQRTSPTSPSPDEPQRIG